MMVATYEQVQGTGWYVLTIVCATTQSDLSLCFPSKEMLTSWLPIERPLMGTPSNLYLTSEISKFPKS